MNKQELKEIEGLIETPMELEQDTFEATSEWLKLDSKRTEDGKTRVRKVRLDKLGRIDACVDIFKIKKTGEDRCKFDLHLSGWTSPEQVEAVKKQIDRIIRVSQLMSNSEISAATGLPPYMRNSVPAATSKASVDAVLDELDATAGK